MRRKNIFFIVFSIIVIWNTSLLAQCTFTNPLRIAESADPFVTFYEGYYYYLFTTGGDVTIRKSFYLEEIGNSEGVKVWDYASENTVIKGHVWAPEIHRINGRWYAYTCGSLTSEQRSENMRMIVLQAFSDDPQSTYTFKAVLADIPAIDQTVWYDHENDKLYIAWSQFDPEGQCIYIAPLESPVKIGTPRVKISAPEHSWEKIGWNVNEGPVFLKRNNKLHIIYSASGCSTPDYCLGLLTCSDGNYLNANSWVKTGPVFSRSDANGVWGPGHNCFVQSPDGSEIWNVYHAKNSSLNTNADRSTRMQKIDWDENDNPLLGIPVKTSQELQCPSEDYVGILPGQSARPLFYASHGVLKAKIENTSSPNALFIFNLNGQQLGYKKNIDADFSISLKKGFYVVSFIHGTNTYKSKIIIN